MFDLKNWQRNLKEEFMNDVEKAKVWSNQINPVIEELLPIWDGLFNKLEQNAQQQVKTVHPYYPITCSVAKPGYIPKGFFSMVDDAFSRHIIAKQPFTEMDHRKLLSTLQNYKSGISIATPIWLHAGICYGDEQLLQQQRVIIRLYSGNKEVILKGYYARYEGALQHIEQLISKAHQIQQTIPFVPDYYASRFYVLQVDEVDSSIKNWTMIDRVEIEPFDRQIEDATNLRLYEEPIWNVEITSLEPRRGTRKLVSNGLHRREFVSTIEAQWLPLVPENGVFCSFEMEQGIGFRATVELPDFISTLPVAIFHDIRLEPQMIHNQTCIDVQIHHSQQPTLSDFQQLVQIYNYVSLLSIKEAKLEIQSAQEGALWRRDCIVLLITPIETDDLFIESRMRALEQLIINFWPYASCRVELEG